MNKGAEKAGQKTCKRCELNVSYIKVRLNGTGIYSYLQYIDVWHLHRQRYRHPPPLHEYPLKGGYHGLGTNCHNIPPDCMFIQSRRYQHLPLAGGQEKVTLQTQNSTMLPE
jgi:hypothetical protein